MQLDISPEAAAYARANGGQLWVWAAYPRLCCSGAPAWMHAATSRPAGVDGFAVVETTGDTPATGVQVQFRRLGGQEPAVLEIGMQGRRHPKVQAYWDGCLMAMT
jgi:hypothetical protein